MLKELLKRPTVTVSLAAKTLKTTYQNSNKVIQDLVKLDILKPKNDNKRNRVFELKGYNDLIYKRIF